VSIEVDPALILQGAPWMGVNRVLHAVGFCLYEQPQISLTSCSVWVCVQVGGTKVKRERAGADHGSLLMDDRMV
jgi:hypothetical protein